MIAGHAVPSFSFEYTFDANETDKAAYGYDPR